MNNQANDFSLYFHIPFCSKKCDYCHFYVIPSKEVFFERYTQALELEWKQSLPLIKNKNLRSVYFGGGTPSQLPIRYLKKIISWIKEDLGHSLSDLEVTLEANPEDIHEELIKNYLEIGINRLSVGVQSLNPHLLPLLGREHKAQTASDAIHTIYNAGIKNISIDLMYDLPQQSFEDWQVTLAEAVKLPIKHLSLYNLTIEPHTAFFKHRDRIHSEQPSEDTSALMYKEAVRVFAEHGLEQYEISAFARQQALSAHNTGYWLGRPFLGLGPSAFSYWGGRRFRNIANLSRYAGLLENGDSPIDFEEKLEEDAHRNEHLMIQLRMLQGVDLNVFEGRFGNLSALVRKELHRLGNEGFLVNKGAHWSLSEKGVLFYDEVAIAFV